MGKYVVNRVKISSEILEQENSLIKKESIISLNSPDIVIMKNPSEKEI